MGKMPVWVCLKCKTVNFTWAKCPKCGAKAP